MSLILNSSGDDMRDTLPDHENVYSKWGSGVLFEFWESSFCVSLLNNKDGQRFQFGYDPSILGLLEPLESGFVSAEMLDFLDALKFDQWDHGMLIAHIHDYRQSEERQYHMRLRIGSEVIRHYYRKNKGRIGDAIDEANFESQALLMIRPDVCVDPSIKVARYASVIDWRQKLWRNREKRRLKSIPHIPHREKRVLHVEPMIEIPDSRAIQSPTRQEERVRQEDQSPIRTGEVLMEISKLPVPIRELLKEVRDRRK
jgi:hypothetical protein